MIDLKALRRACEISIAKYGSYEVTTPQTVIALLDRLEAAEKDAALGAWYESLPGFKESVFYGLKQANDAAMKEEQK